MYFRLLILVIIISFACSQSGDEETDVESYCESIYDDVVNSPFKFKKKVETNTGGITKPTLDKDATRENIYSQIDASAHNDFEGMVDSAATFLVSLSAIAPVPAIGEVARVLAFAWVLFKKKQSKAKKQVGTIEAVTEALEKQSSINWELKLHALKVDIHEVIENSCKYHKNRSAPFSATENYNALNDIKIAEFSKSLELTFCKDQKDKDDEKIKRCLLMANLYADFQILRQIAIACYNLAISIPKETTENEKTSPPQVALDEESNREPSKQLLLKGKLQRILKKDLEALSFLHKVMEMRSGGHRIHIFAELYSNLTEYQSLNTYMAVLGKKFGKELDTIIFTQAGLKGRIRLDHKNYPKLPFGAATIYGIFVPHNKYVYLYHMEDLKGTFSGPYYGQAMYAVVRNPGIWASLTITTPRSVRDTRKMVRICGQLDLKGECISLRKADYDLDEIKTNKSNTFSSTSEDVKYICQTENGRSTSCNRVGLPIVDNWFSTYTNKLNKFLCSINGSRQNWDCFRSNDWTWRVRSMVVPRGLTVYVRQFSRILNKESLIKMIDWYGPYTGPQFAAHLPPFASELAIEDTDPSILRIRLCTRPNLKGECGEKTIDQRKAEEEEGQVIDVTQGINNIPFHMRFGNEKPWDSMGYSPELTQLRSMEIPDGYDVITASGEKGNTKVLTSTLSGYVKDIPIEGKGRKVFKIYVKKQSETRFKAAKIKEKDDTIF